MEILIPNQVLSVIGLVYPISFLFIDLIFQKNAEDWRRGWEGNSGMQFSNTLPTITSRKQKILSGQLEGRKSDTNPTEKNRDANH